MKKERGMPRYECRICGYIYDPATEGAPWDELAGDWACPICSADKSYFEALPATVEPSDETPTTATADGLDTYLGQWQRSSDELEDYLAVIQQMAVTGASVIEPMRSRRPVISWHEILIKGAQLARLPLNEQEPVSTRTVIGPQARQPLVIESPVYVSHMSFGALSREVKIALARGTAAVKTAICSGEGGILPDSMAAAYRYIFEYVPNRYSVTEENLQAADAIEIKIGQSAKPGMGGHLPGSKVTEEIAGVRGFAAGKDIISPARHDDISDTATLKDKIDWLRRTSGGRPVGVKLAAGHIEADLEIAVAAGPDFITIDGRAGATGAAAKMIKDATSVPTIYALARARRFLDAKSADGISLIITGGLRVSADFAKALALGADAVAIASSAMIAAGCQQYRICHTGKCPVGIATQDPELRGRLDIELSARRVEHFLRVSTDELADFARLTGHDDVHQLGPGDLCTTSSEIATYTDILHAGEPEPPA
jgi:glutamate synthase domain-containing protein 2/rubredoxin